MVSGASGDNNNGSGGSNSNGNGKVNGYAFHDPFEGLFDAAPLEGKGTGQGAGQDGEQQGQVASGGGQEEGQGQQDQQSEQGNATTLPQCVIETIERTAGLLKSVVPLLEAEHPEPAGECKTTADELLELLQSQIPDSQEDKCEFIKPALHRIVHSKQRAFLKRLAKHGQMVLACHQVGIGRSTVPFWRENTPGFTEAEEEALMLHRDRLEFQSVDMSLNGEKKKKFYKGMPIDDPETGKQYFEVERNAGLLLAELKANKREKFRDGNGLYDDASPEEKAEFIRLIRTIVEFAGGKIQFDLEGVISRNWNRVGQRQGVIDAAPSAPTGLPQPNV